MILHKIHVISHHPEICLLIRKTLSNGKYSISCSGHEEITEPDIQKLPGDLDCIILDFEIDSSIKMAIKKQFSNVPIICLPSLNEDQKSAAGVKHISEPLRPSELSMTIKKLFE